VTLTGPPVTLRELIDGACPDPKWCRFWLSYASDPWACEFNHPSVESRERVQEESKTATWAES